MIGLSGSGKAGDVCLVLHMQIKMETHLILSRLILTLPFLSEAFHLAAAGWRKWLAKLKELSIGHSMNGR